MISWLRETGRAMRCFWDWPLLHTRIMVYAYLVFSMFEIDTIRAANSETKIHSMIADGLMTGMLLVIAFYVSPKIAEFMASWLGSKFGGAIPGGAIVNTQEISSKTQTVKVAPESRK